MIAADARDAELEDLRRRLAEAEDTIAAIRDGRVDALVLRGDDEDQIFSLASGGESYRSFMQAMDTGAAALDHDGRLLYANQSLCELLCLSFEELLEKGLVGAVGDVIALKIESLLADCNDPRETVEVVIPCGGRERHIVISAATLPLSFGDGHALTFSDVTESMEAAAASESERIGQAVMASATSAVVVCDPAGVITHANAAVRSIYETNPVGLRFTEAFPLEFAVGAGFLDSHDVIAAGIAGNSVRAVEALTNSKTAIQDVLVSVYPLRFHQGMASGCVVTMLDMTERKAVEKRQALLMRELDHRVKNTLTLVLSIANRTVAGSADLNDFHQKFGRRIEALAATHNLLADGSWRQLSIENVVSTELAPYVVPSGPRVHLENLGLKLDPDAAIALGLVIHELVTNAVKYGALSNDTGTISMIGTRQPGDILEIVWREEGGPPVKVPTKSGFGQTLIARSLGSAGGGTEVDFAPSGLICKMRFVSKAVSER